jgi:predicted nucleic acid-binding protein
VKKKGLLDSFALLAYLKKENNFQKVKDTLQRAKDQNEPLLMNEINIGEVYYILAKERSLSDAETFLDLLPTLPIKPVHNTFQDVIEASKIKAKYAISYPDCFACTTAIQEEAIILTGDPDFRMVEKIVKIEWL